jgi:pilus assembly protein Flp/PilA
MMSPTLADCIVTVPHRGGERRTTRSITSMDRLFSLIVARLGAARDDEAGATMVEYGLMLALIAVVSITIITTIGTDLLAKFTSIANAL